MTDKDLTLKLDRARWHVLSNQPFYGQLAMGLVDVLDERVPTACTDGKRIRWGKAFLEQLSDEETRFCLLHETLHVAHQHLWRFPSMTPRENVACDHAINLTLQSVQGITMPACGIADPVYKGLAEEEILARLPQDPPKQDGCGDFEQPAPDGDGDQPGQPQDPLRDQWERRVIQAAQAAKALGQGDLPADMERVLERMNKQRVDWRSETADFVKTSVSVRNDWSRCARRHAHQPVIYPRKRSDDLGVVVFVRDTSGSTFISPEIIGQFTGLIDQCLADVGCRGVVMDCDTEIHAEHHLGPGESCPDKAQGGGGTAFELPFIRAQEIEDEGDRIAGVVYLTDGFGSFPEPVEIPTLWLCTTDVVAPFGRTVRIEE